MAELTMKHTCQTSLFFSHRLLVYTAHRCVKDALETLRETWNLLHIRILLEINKPLKIIAISLISNFIGMPCNTKKYVTEEQLSSFLFHQ